MAPLFCSTSGLSAALFLLALQLTPSSAQLIRGFTLIDVSTNEDLRSIVDGDEIDRNEYISIPLTIRVDIADNETVPWVRIVWNDGPTRSKAAPPYYLAGDNDGDAVEATALSEVGTYTIEAAALDERFAEIEVLKIEFSIIDPSLEVSPTATPLSIYDVEPYQFSSGGEINGELKLWHKVTIGFSGVITGESNNIDNPFLDLRLDVTFEHKASAKKYVVPGFYACNGNAANTGASSGFVWLVRGSKQLENGLTVCFCRFISALMRLAHGLTTRLMSKGRMLPSMITLPSLLPSLMVQLVRLRLMKATKSHQIYAPREGSSMLVNTT